MKNKVQEMINQVVNGKDPHQLLNESTYFSKDDVLDILTRTKPPQKDYTAIEVAVEELFSDNREQRFDDIDDALRASGASRMSVDDVLYSLYSLS